MYSLLKIYTRVACRLQNSLEDLYYSSLQTLYMIQTRAQVHQTKCPPPPHK